jgi:sulfur carrier protein
MDFLRVRYSLGTGTMRVVINGKAEELPGGTVLEILKAKGVDPHMVAVELNAKILEREELSRTAVKEGDALELLFYMGGGR